MNCKILALLLTLATILPNKAICAGVDDYLILQDIGPYKLSKLHKSLPGEPPIGGPRTFDGATIVSGAGHFSDHTDTSYEVDYYDFTGAYNSPTVQVTQHAGGDSDKWLLHEVEDCLRSSDKEKLGRRSDSASFRRVGNADIFKISIAGAGYYWISNNVTVFIEYRDYAMTKPEPIEVIQAYLNKYPPTLPPNYKIFNGPAHDLVWIKDELERRQWLSDKWLALIQENDPKLKDKLYEMVDSMKVFLDYREKYYGIAASDDKDLLGDYVFKSDKGKIVGKLNEYKSWWGDNKSVAISLTTIPFKQRVVNWWKKLFSYFGKMVTYIQHK